MSDPSVYNDHRRAAEVGRKLKELEQPNRLARDWRATHDDLGAARGDGDLLELVPELEQRIAAIEDELRIVMAPRDPADEKDVIVEVRGAAGGEEASLWAQAVKRMLQRYAERRGFKTETLEEGENES